MGSGETPSPLSTGKQRRYSEEAAVEESKRRKHHHHRHHHRRHHRHESHGRDRDDGEKFKLINDASLGFRAVARVDEDEREEGEIVEDEDVEPGEFELDADSNQAVRVAEHNGTIAKGSKEQLGDANSGAFSNSEPMVDEREVSGVKSGNGRRLEQSLSPQNSTGNGSTHRGIAEDYTSQARVGSPLSGESTRRKKYKGRHGDEDLDEKLQRLEFNWHSDSGDAGRESLNNNYDSKSPESSRDKNRDDRSPTHSRHHDEVLHRGRSRSRDHGREKPCELDGVYGSHFNVKESRRNYSDSENTRVHDRLDKFIDRITESDGRNHREREKSSSYGRHNDRDDRHGSWGRKTEKEEQYRSSRDTDNVEEGKWVRGVRERSSSRSRHDMQEKRHRNRDREHERISSSSSLRGRERLRDMSKESYKETESLRDVNGDRKRGRGESDRDISQARDRERSRNQGRERSRNQGRERGVKTEIDRVSSQERPARDNPRYDELEYKNERKKSKDLSKERRSTAESMKVEKEKPAREEDEEDYQEKVEQQLAKQDEEDVDKIKEESRKRRQAILEKYKQLQLQQNAASGSNDPEKGVAEKKLADNEKSPEANSNNTVEQVPSEGPENKLDHSEVYVAYPSFVLDKSPIQNGEHSLEKTAGTGGLGEGTPKSERSADMFCDDIFGESPAGVRRLSKSDCLQIETGGLHDNWDDAEGYYSYRFGEILDGRYEVIAAHGKGVFSTVVRAKDLKPGKGDPEEVAIKIIRNNDTMYKAGLEELTILKRLAGADPDDRRHCVRFISNFKYRNHLCLVFESLHMNLREVLKKFGRNIGLKLTAVRAYAKQLFIALKHLRNCGVLHCDIKPDNMLVNEAKNVLKLCDFGNAMFSGKNEITPYLVSRFYRAPEIILGLPYDHAMDVWSVGCCLYELYSGKVLFPGPSNNDMLRLHMELKGPFPKKMLRKGAFTDQHFDQDLNFHSTEEDPVTKKNVKRLLLTIKPKDIGALISGSPGEDPKMLTNFKDLLERIFVLDPEKRMTVSQALGHPFITGK